MARRLAAILAADVVGYSVLMGADQEGTLAALRTLRAEVFGPAVAGHRGKLVKSMGDGWLVEFGSAVDAVTCGMQVQDRLAAHETIKLRIGIHIGDVVHEEEDVFGDGVNVAARLDGIAEPGAVVLSDAVYGALDGTLRPSFDEQGEHVLRNIERPVRVWVRTTGERGGVGGAGASYAGARTGSHMLALRPVSTSDDRAEVRELADALTSDLGSYLGSLTWLDVSTASGAVEAGYAMDGTLRARGDRLRLEMRLTASDGMPVSTEKFDGDLADSFVWQDNVGEEVASRVIGTIIDIERLKLARKSLHEMTAAECYLQGWIATELKERHSFSESFKHLQAAVEKDPGFADAHAYLILAAISVRKLGYSEILEPYLERLERWLETGRRLTEQSASLQIAIAVHDFFESGDVAALRREIQSVLRRAPFSAEAMLFCGWAYLWHGDPEPALDCFRRAEKLIRFTPWADGYYGGMAVGSVMAGRDEQAIAVARRGIDISPHYLACHRVLAAASAHLGRMDDAAAALAEVLRQVPEETIDSMRKRFPQAQTPEMQRYLDGLRLAGLPEGAP